MKHQLNRLFQSTFPTQVRRALSTAVVTLTMVTLACSTLPAGAQPTGSQSQQGAAPAQVAQILQLLANFHGSLSYGGNITNMMSLWADNSSISFNGTPHVGKDAVQAFFTSSGYFHNYWVSLAPEYKTQITVNGNMAVATTQCVAIDVNPASPTFHTVLSVVQVNATAVLQQGTWLFTSMDNTAPAPL